MVDCFILFQILEREGEENEALHKMIANEQKTSLPNLFQDKNRPCLSNWPEVSWSLAQMNSSSLFKALAKFPSFLSPRMPGELFQNNPEFPILICLVLSKQGDFL